MKKSTDRPAYFLFFYITSFIVSILFSSPSIAQDNSICPADLPKEINQIIQRKTWQRSRWGILIKKMNSNETIYALDEDKFFIPASNAKLLTTAAVLHKLGANFRISTPVYVQGNPPNLTTLKIVGRGDPSLNTSQLQELARQLKAQGVNYIGELIVEDSYFSDSPINNSWEWSDLLFYYAPSVNSLILNENATTIKLIPQALGEELKIEYLDDLAVSQWQIHNNTVTDSKENNLDYQGVFTQPVLQINGSLAINTEPKLQAIAIANPSQYFIDTLQKILDNQGIKVNKKNIIYNKEDNSKFKIWDSIKSESLGNLIAKVNQDSNNLFAEALLKILGNEYEKKQATEAVKESLTELGVNSESYNLADGSGLSRQNLVSPAALVQTLQLMKTTPQAGIYEESLALAGVKGTLKNRFTDTVIQGKLYGKTGGLTGVSSLSGYLYLPNYEPIVFSLIINQSNHPYKNRLDAIDEIILLVSRLKDC